MAHPKAMGLTAMFIFLVIAVVFLPILVRYIDRMEPQYIISGFQNQQQAPAAQGAPTVAHGDVKVPSAASGYHDSDPSRYMCRSPNGAGQPCPEGTFCDAASQSCIAMYMGGPVPDTGYFS